MTSHHGLSNQVADRRMIEAWAARNLQLEDVAQLQADRHAAATELVRRALDLQPLLRLGRVPSSGLAAGRAWGRIHHTLSAMPAPEPP